MTLTEILDELARWAKAGRIGDLASVKHALPDLIFYAPRLDHPCEHPKDKRDEVRRGDRSVDVICRACGGLVDYRE